MAVRALSTGAAESGQKVIVAALNWSWRSATVDPLTGEVSVHPRDMGPGQADLAALEHALRLAELRHSKVVAVTAGPPAADVMLRDALAAGASEAIRVELAGRAGGTDPARLVGGDPFPAIAVAGALRQQYGSPDLVLCGDHTAERGTGSFPAFLAAELGAQQVLGVVRIEAGKDGALRVVRRLDGGRREVLLITGPAVVSVEAAGVRLRRADLPSVLGELQAPVPVTHTAAVTAAARVQTLAVHPYRPRPRELPAPAGGKNRRLRELTGALAERTPPTVLGPLSPGAAAEELIGYLRRHGYLEDGKA
jgi:electron transfer flavoprotein beta subunit